MDMGKFSGKILFFFLISGFLAFSQQPRTPGTPPQLSEIQGVLERVSPLSRSLPLFPSNNLTYHRGDYTWGVGGIGVPVRVYVVEDRESRLSNFTQPRNLCAGMELRFAQFEDKALVVTPIGSEGRWLVFEFPDSDLPICGFMNGFIDLYSFFLRVVQPGDSGTSPPFPGVIGTLLSF